MIDVLNINQQNIERFWNKVEIQDNDCWNWIGAEYKGYGRIGINGIIMKAHRFAYELFKTIIPKNLVIDHLCRNTLCVNPDHLEAVTQKENIMRGNSFIVEYSKKTHCKHGHLLSGDNLYLKNGYLRQCKKCNNISHRKLYRKKQNEL